MTAEYLQSYEDYFWQWEEEGKVLAIPNGNTIAYADYIFLDLLPKISHIGLPPFGVLLSALIALNPDGIKSIKKIFEILNTKPLYIPKEAQEFLGKIASLPPQYRANDFKPILLQLLFETSHKKFQLKLAEKLIDVYKKETIISYTQPKPYSIAIVNRDLRVLELLNKHFDSTEDIITKLQQVPPLSAEIILESIDAPEHPKVDFIQELIEQPITFKVGALIKRIWSGLHIPYHQQLPSQQPIGGISDLTNKGSLDRLLISEFANDDLIFLSRLANNEALYIQREIPPQNNDKERIIVLDASIRNWGIPKTISFALMIAIAKHPKNNFPCKAIAIGNEMKEIKFDSVDDIIESMKYVAASLDATIGFEQLMSQDNLDKKTEIILISSKESMAMPNFQSVVFNHFEKINYWIQMDRLGNTDVYKNEHRTKKHIQNFQLPLQELWQQTKSTKKEDKTAEPIVDFPLLFALSIPGTEVFKTPDGKTFYVDNQRNLFLYDHRDSQYQQKGWNLITRLVFAIEKKCAFGINADGEIVYMGISKNFEYTFYNATQNIIFKNTNQTIAIYSIKSLFFENSTWHIHTFHRATYAIDIVNGEIIIQLATDIKVIESEPVTTAQTGITVLKNVDRIAISPQGHLVVNKHQLVFNPQNKSFKLMKLRDTWYMKDNTFIEAAPNSDKSLFTFANGSSIQVHKCGMLVLKAASTTINYKIKQVNSGPNKVALCKELRQETQFSLSHIKKQVDNDGILASYQNKNSCESFLQLLQQKYPGFDARIEESEENDTIFIPTALDKKLGIVANDYFAGDSYFYKNNIANLKQADNLDQFFQKYLQSFIDAIL